MSDLIIYTDGGCRNNGNHKDQHVKPTDASGWAFIVQEPTNHKAIQVNQGSFGQTNNQMELTAITEALLYIYKNYSQFATLNIQCILDSRYVLNAIQKGWLDNWATNQWQNAQNQPVKNPLLWQRFYNIYQQFPLDNIEWVWTKGHADNQGNLDVDKLVNDAMDTIIKTKSKDDTNDNPN